ncbi:adenosine deaminase [Terribacillus saccharophilus]|jgi:adenine deaminase|uniref:Adenine deaminase n=1 Tax=Terribacillus saccharophilus TaxID=361277 RepID=A0A268HE33_9BACI|nr:adenine deaminase C-terminal domain-containing protein [Terribacillus saccharophilus]PAD34425.1 adenosine deaminase [Terribacillus saccharophilus]PAD95299.1 adenosine deaminase [Terribacillus saccharophilus]PAD98752.1 adenosine deaminase [Terribacillus saccharophilus]PAE08113.1 adenosine deaminase [Terribacillus saccharophilus]
MLVDLLIRDVRVFNSYRKKFIDADVAVLEGKFLYIGKKDTDKLQPKSVLDGAGRYMVPGLIDIHLHIESTMITPSSFSYGIIQNGVTTIVPEPHEMANVFGVDGVKSMMKASADCAVDMFYGIPSSVPATSMETTGGEIDIQDIDELMLSGNIQCLGEIMNYYDVISAPDSKTNRILAHVRQAYPNLIVEGHVPKLLDLELQRMIYAGVDSDHTHQTVEGMEQRINAGMFVELQEKSMTQEIINYVIENDVTEHFCFVTDDVMADKLLEEGHLNQLVQKAIHMGMQPEQAIYAATAAPAKRMQMKDRGLIAPGKIADFILLDDLHGFSIQEVFKRGQQVYEKDAVKEQIVLERQFPSSYYESIKLEELKPDDFLLLNEKEESDALYRVMEIKDGSTFTTERHVRLAIEAGQVKWQEEGLALVMTAERYGKNGNRAFGLLTGDMLKEGAIATTYSHDNHNLLVIGRDIEDMVLAANEVIRQQGGICCVKDGEILSLVQLPVGGILSEAPLKEVAAQVSDLTKSIKSLGYKHYNVLMSISTLSLPVSPALKLTDHGYIRVNEGNMVPLRV